MNYVIKELTDVFTYEFSLYIMSTSDGGMQKSNLMLIMKEVQKYEIRYNLQFVNFYGNEYIIFREL